MKRFSRPPAAALAILCLCLSKAAAQTFYWTGADGKETSAKALELVPEWARRDMRCESKVVEVMSGDFFEIEGGLRVRLIGVDAPRIDHALKNEFIALSKAKLKELLNGGAVTLRFDEDTLENDEDLLAYVVDSQGRSVNEEMIRSGWGQCAIKLPNAAKADKFYAAQREARAELAGLWQGPVIEMKRDTAQMRIGFSLGLYSQQDTHDYSSLLHEMKDVGCTHAMIITPWFLEDFEGVKIYRRTSRSAQLKTVEATCRKARELGMKVMLMPIVLLANADKKHWRGNIEPKDLNDWFSSYNDFILPFADIARRSGAESLVMGSEFSSLERYTDHWKSVVRNCRARFDGVLTYSANWDHLDVIKFWDDLDMIGMTGYHSLTKEMDPSVEAITEKWIEVRAKLVADLEKRGRPYFFTELGYASLDGINKDPWDYVSPVKTDLKEQADCYEAWFLTWEKQRQNFKGAYFYTWWRNDNEDDARGYTIYGKPAEDVLRKWLKKIQW